MLLTGKLSVREEEPVKLIVDLVEPLNGGAGKAAAKKPEKDTRTDAEKAQDAKEKLYLRMDRAALPACERILAEDPGTVPVYVNRPAEGITLLLPSGYWVRSGKDTEARLMHLLPAENMKSVIRV